MTAAWLRAGRVEFAHWSGANRLSRRRLDGRRAAVLNYHRVLEVETARREAVEEGMFVTPATFARQLDWLIEHFQVMPLHEIVAAIRQDRTLPERACAITFDDGWRDNLTHALPALEARGLPGTVFVVTGRIGSNGAFWPDEIIQILRALPGEQQKEMVRQLGAPASDQPADALIEHLKDVPREVRESALTILREQPGAAEVGAERVLLDWDELGRMARGGVAIEAHGVSHDMLTGLDDDAALEELVESRRVLIERGHGLGGLFAYPAGRHDDRVCRLTEEAGYAAAFTIERGLLARDSRPFALPRLMIHEGMSSTKNEFLMRVPGWS